MVYTVTFNPALDYVMQAGDIEIGSTNRSLGEEIYIGGKGVNVSLVLHELNVDSTALGFIAGFTGDEFERQIKNRGVKSDFIKLSKGNTRINVKIKGGDETEINGKGPDISMAELKMFLSKIREIADGDILVLSGSLPGSLPDTTYCDILEILKDKKINIVVDTSGSLLLSVLKYKPFMIKPNFSELCEIFKKGIKGEKEIAEYAKKLQEMGARNVLVSMARDGALLLTENGDVIKISSMEGTTVNSVGAGDSMVAGFIAGYMETSDYSYSLKLGSVCGAATAFSKDIAKRDKILEILGRI